MNRKNFMIPIFIAAAIVFIIGVCLNIYLEFDNSLRSSVEQFDSDSEFVEEQSKQTSEGYLTVFDHAGVTHFQYEGEIIIEMMVQTANLSIFKYTSLMRILRIN